MKNFTIAASKESINEEILLDNQIKSIKGQILINMIDMVKGYKVTEKNVERYLSDLKAAKIENGTSERTAAADGSQRKPILLFITGNTAVDRAEAEQKVNEFLATSVSMQGLSKQVKAWVKEAENAADAVNNINNESDNEDAQDETSEAQEVAEEIVSNLPEIEAEPMPTLTIEQAQSPSTTDNIRKVLKVHLEAGWTFEQIRSELDKLEAEMMSKAA